MSLQTRRRAQLVQLQHVEVHVDVFICSLPGFNRVPAILQYSDDCATTALKLGSMLQVMELIIAIWAAGQLPDCPAGREHGPPGVLYPGIPVIQAELWQSLGDCSAHLQPHSDSSLSESIWIVCLHRLVLRLMVKPVLMVVCGNKSSDEIFEDLKKKKNQNQNQITCCNVRFLFSVAFTAPCSILRQNKQTNTRAHVYKGIWLIVRVTVTIPVHAEKHLLGLWVGRR